jgi:hypothetical protein
MREQARVIPRIMGRNAVNDQRSLGGFWSSIRDLNAGYFTIAIAVLALLLAVYLLRFRPVAVTIGDVLPSLDRFEKVATLTAYGLILLAVLAAIVEVGQPIWEQDGSGADFLAAVRQLDWAYIIVVASFILLFIAIYLLDADDPNTIAELLGNARRLWTSFTEEITAETTQQYLFGIAGLLLVFAVIISATRALWPGFVSAEFTSIAPFAISGSEDKQKGIALATAYRSKLAQILRDSRITSGVLQKGSAEAEAEAGVLPSQNDSEKDALTLSHKSAFELKFQGVDVGGLLNWAVDWFSMRRAMQITVAEQGTNAVVSGALRPDGSSHVYASVENKNERIVAAVAFSKLRERLIAQQLELRGLDWEQVEKLHQTIMEVIQLRGRSQTKKKDYEKHADTMASLIAMAPRSERLLTIGSEVAMKAGRIDQALAYLDRTNESLNRDRELMERKRPDAPRSRYRSTDADNPDDALGYAELRRNFVRRYNLQLVQRQRIISSCALGFVEQLHDGAAPEAIFKDALAHHKLLLKIGDIEKKRDATIAIIGGVPQRELVGYRFSAAGNWVVGNYGLDNYADTIGLVISTLAPRAKLVFIPLGAESRSRGLTLVPAEREIAEAMAVAANANADIALIPFAPPPLNWKARAQTIAGHVSKMIIVSPAPTKAALSGRGNAESSLDRLDAIFVANVDVDGRFKGALLSASEEPTSYPGALWAPGTRIPRLMADAMWETTYGSTYAAAMAAAVVANVVAGTERKPPGEIIAAVRKSLYSPDSRNPTIGVISQAAALSLTATDPAPMGSACGHPKS